jgi:oligopeptide/dipeptide ABC transporter ATP-binding protein
LDDVLVSIRGLKTYYSIRGSFLSRLVGREAGHVRAVDDVSIELRRGEVLGLVGESGSGKTTLGRTVLGLVQATEGSVRFEGREITKMSERELRALRREMQIVFQDPHASLNPAMTIAQLVEHPLQIHRIGTKSERRNRVEETLSIVGLDPPEQFMDKYPSDLSGGQKQRVVIARAIILNPILLVADEPVSMLDMSVRAKILELMLYLKRQLNLTYLYITHDLATAKFFCDRIAIMYLGQIVELGPAADIYERPHHPYTAALLRAIPEPDPRRTVPRDLPRGEVPDAVVPPLGCPFHPRCPKAFEVCGWESRDLRTLLEDRWTRLSQDDYERERAGVGNLDVLDVPSVDTILPVPDGGTGEQPAEVLAAMRADAADDPFWSGVAATEVTDAGVRARFHEPRVPRDLRVDRSVVRCHLHDPEALAAAEEIRRGRDGTQNV